MRIGTESILDIFAQQVGCSGTLRAILITFADRRNATGASRGLVGASIKRRSEIMAMGRKQQVGVFVGSMVLLCMGAVFAHEGVTPEKSFLEGSVEISEKYVPRVHFSPPPQSTAKPSPDELKEIEWIKSQLGSSYSIAARLERLTVAEQSSAEADLPKIVGPDVEVWETSPNIGTTRGETRMLRTMARQLEQSAAELEERGDFKLADQMRQLALSHWRLARVAGSGQSGNSDEAER